MNAATNTWRVYSALTGVGYNRFAVNLDPAVAGAVSIAGDANLFSSVGYAQLIITGSPATGNQNKALWIGIDTTNNAGVLQAGVGGTGWNNLILNPSGGNVGIGSTSPTSTLTLGNSAGLAWAAAYRTIDMLGYSFITGSSNLAGFSGTGYGQGMWGNNTYWNVNFMAIGAAAASYIMQSTGQIGFNVAPSVAVGAVQTFTEAMHIANNGFVGIGKQAPAVALDVVGQISCTGGLAVGLTPGNNTIQLNGPSKTTASGYCLCQLISSGDGSNYLLGQIGLNTDPTGTNRRLAISAQEVGIAWRNVTLCETAGNVGIGTANPDHLLTFAATTGDKISFLQGQMWGFGLQSSLIQIITSSNSGDVAFGWGTSASFTEVMRVKGNGNVGIGTTGPGAQLHILGAGTTNVTYTPGNATGGTLYLQDTGGAVNAGGQLLFGSTFGPHCGIKAAVQTGSGPGGDMIFQTAVNGGSGVCQERMRVTNGGLIGINTTTPTLSGTGKFHIGGANTTRFFDTVRTPGSSAEACYIGEVFFDQNYLYVCTANNQIRRIALSAF
jgi:hypothetical protein